MTRTSLPKGAQREAYLWPDEIPVSGTASCNSNRVCMDIWAYGHMERWKDGKMKR